jgi:hypothetical protein
VGVGGDAKIRISRQPIQIQIMMDEKHKRTLDISNNKIYALI